ncbi:hypothetical protein GCM10022247_52780 [Allokutzneria multivorans]|uniref:Uncharacterized protein n=1 Tax=Allokutzneria multivorans TaxID=1142134 RepID=A0ABP7T717_9PSEU
MNVAELVLRLPELGLAEDAIGAGSLVRDRMCVAQDPESRKWAAGFIDGNGRPGRWRAFADESAACWYLYGELAADQVWRGVLGPAGGGR